LPGWDIVKQRMDLSEQGRKQLIEYSQAAVNRFSSKFGLKCQIEFDFDWPIMKLTFSQD
jgi:hypothetical protein